MFAVLYIVPGNAKEDFEVAHVAEWVCADAKGTSLYLETEQTDLHTHWYEQEPYFVGILPQGQVANYVLDSLKIRAQFHPDGLPVITVVE